MGALFVIQSWRLCSSGAGRVFLIRHRSKIGRIFAGLTIDVKPEIFQV